MKIDLLKTIMEEPSCEKRSLTALKEIILLSSDEVELICQGKCHYEYYWEYMSIHIPWLIVIPKFAFDFFGEGAPGSPNAEWDWSFLFELSKDNIITPEELEGPIASFSYDDVVKYINIHSFDRSAEVLIEKVYPLLLSYEKMDDFLNRTDNGDEESKAKIAIALSHKYIQDDLDIYNRILDRIIQYDGNSTNILGSFTRT
jgi:hypothetical protein